MAGDEIDRALNERLLAQLRRQVDMVDARSVEPDLLGEGGKQAERGVEHRRAELLAGEVGRLGDPALLQRMHAEGREIIDHEDAEDFLAGILDVVLDQRVQVGEADVVGAGRDALHGAGRALAGVHRHVQPLGLVVALLEGDEEGRGRPLEHPVEREFERRLGRCAIGRGEREDAAERQRADAPGGQRLATCPRQSRNQPPHAHHVRRPLVLICEGDANGGSGGGQSSAGTILPYF